MPRRKFDDIFSRLDTIYIVITTQNARSCKYFFQKNSPRPLWGEGLPTLCPIVVSGHSVPSAPKFSSFLCYPAPFLADQSRRYIYYTLRAASSEQCASSDMTITADRLSHAVGGQQSTVAINQSINIRLIMA